MKILINGKWVSITKVSAADLLKALLPDFEEETNKFLKVTDGSLSWAAGGSGGYDGDPTVIQQSASYRLVTDDEKTTWNSKAAGNHNHNGVYQAAGDYAASDHNHDLTYSLLNHNHDSDYASMSHNHDSDYEPKDANIQSHIISAHAPSNAQKNSDITKAEIEAKLTGEINTHTHPPSNPYIAKLILAGNVATGANVTPVNLTGMAFDYVAGGIYRIDIYGIVRSAAATTGHGFGVNCTTAPVEVCLSGGSQLANTGTGTSWSAIANNAIVGVTSGLPSANTNVMSLGGGVIRMNGTTGGTCQFIFRSETTAVTNCMANTVILITKVN